MVQRCVILCELDVRALHVPEENTVESVKENKDLWRNKTVVPRLKVM